MSGGACALLESSPHTLPPERVYHSRLHHFGGCLMTVAELIKELRNLDGSPREPVYCQVVGNKSGAWLMNFEVRRCETGFNVIRVTHPDLHVLASWDTLRAVQPGYETLLRKHFQLTRLLRSYYNEHDANPETRLGAPCACLWCQEIREDNLLS